MISGATEIALRAYVVHPDCRRRYHNFKREENPAPEIVAVFDTESRADETQSLTFGSFGIWVAGKLHRLIIFHSKNLTKQELTVLSKYVKRRAVGGIGAELMPLECFIEEIFYPCVYDIRSLLIAFNLPFDLSRLSVRYGVGRNRWKGGFTFTLSKNRFRTPIRIKSLDSTKAFIEFARPTKRNQRHPKLIPKKLFKRKRRSFYYPERLSFHTHRRENKSHCNCRKNKPCQS